MLGRVIARLFNQLLLVLNISLFVIVIHVLFSYAYAQQPVPDLQQNPINEIIKKDIQSVSTGMPKLVIENDIYDFGNIIPGSTNTAVFRFSNLGDSSLIITDIKKCCGAVITLDKQELEPGQNCILTAKYTVGTAIGLFNRRISFSTNDPNMPQAALVIKGEVSNTLTWSPENLEIASFKNKNECPDIKIMSLNDTAFSVNGFISTGDYLSANYDPNCISTEIVLKPEIVEDNISKITSNTGFITIDVNHPDYKTIQLSFDIIPSLQATPSRIILYTSQKESFVKTIELKDNSIDGDSIMKVSEQIDSIVFKNGSKVEVVKAIDNKNCCKFELNINPIKGKDSESYSKDSIVITMKDGRDLVLPAIIIYKFEKEIKE